MKVKFIKRHSGFGIKEGEIKDIIEVNALKYIAQGYCVAVDVVEDKHECKECNEPTKKGKKKTVCKECEEQRINKK